jgi:acyl-CoA synthetase (AMP-forming)/AMP-acid ligase II
MTTSIVSRFWNRACCEKTKNKKTFIELNEVGEELDSLSNSLLHEKALAFAEQIKIRTNEGDRAVLLYPAGHDFIIAFLACLYAKVIAVPVNPPTRNNKSQRLLSIVKDSSPNLFLSTSKIHGIASESPGLKKYIEQGNWHVFDQAENVPKTLLACPTIDPDSIAFLQYTSGSTGDPKGVMISHANLLHNSSVVAHSFSVCEESVLVSFLPMFHDLGLVGIVLQAIYGGATCVTINPSVFLRSPDIWLRSIDKYRGTHSGGPNFAFEHCYLHAKDSKLGTWIYPAGKSPFAAPSRSESVL